MPNLTSQLREHASKRARQPEMPAWFIFAGIVALGIAGVLIVVSVFFSPDPAEDIEGLADIREQTAALTPPGDEVSAETPTIDPDNVRIYVFDHQDGSEVTLTEFEVLPMVLAATSVYSGDTSDIPSVGTGTPPTVPGNWSPTVENLTILEIVTAPDSEQWVQFTANVHVLPNGNASIEGSTPIEITLVWDDELDFWAADW